MANLDPWSYAAKTNSEHSEQVALFMWANMAYMFGPIIAADATSYNVKGWAQKQFENAGKLGYKIYSAPIVQLKWLHAIHNQGHGDAIRGGRARAEGVKAGVADIFLPMPRYMYSNEKGGFGPEHLAAYCGLYIELKRKDGGRAAAEQLEFKQDMIAAGYKAEICNGWELAKDTILAYLGIS